MYQVTTNNIVKIHRISGTMRTKILTTELFHQEKTHILMTRQITVIDSGNNSKSSKKTLMKSSCMAQTSFSRWTKAMSTMIGFEIIPLTY